ncbi:hypothetical protein [Daphnis nerii cypovirus]|uniref:hypothetical protein n=1 Tax=Daphnis nerii cypovirus TaxID=1986950 RepID=UPI000EB773AF|nr:hypothetical protein [Daphnis nerii cypovirus]AYA29384.1 hypothetical protein [Daphnis nerii cypovirus]UGZ05868.1 putative non-structural protein [Clanis bilineata cypovirus]
MDSFIKRSNRPEQQHMLRLPLMHKFLSDASLRIGAFANIKQSVKQIHLQAAVEGLLVLEVSENDVLYRTNERFDQLSLADKEKRQKERSQRMKAATRSEVFGDAVERDTVTVLNVIDWNELCDESYADMFKEATSTFVAELKAARLKSEVLIDAMLSNNKYNINTLKRELSFIAIALCCRGGDEYPPIDVLQFVYMSRGFDYQTLMNGLSYGGLSATSYKKLQELEKDSGKMMSTIKTSMMSADGTKAVYQLPDKLRIYGLAAASQIFNSSSISVPFASRGNNWNNLAIDLSDAVNFGDA